MEQRIPADRLPRYSDDLPDDAVCIWTDDDIRTIIKRVLDGEFDDQEL